MSVLSSGGVPTEPRTADAGRYLSWMDREIEFHDVRLEEIIGQLERWHDLQIAFKDESLLKLRVSMHIDNRPIRDILDLVGAMTDQRYERAENNIRFSAK